MGYCPRCGENSALGTSVEADREREPSDTGFRIPVNSEIVHFPPGALERGELSYGGTTFRIRTVNGRYILEPLL